MTVNKGPMIIAVCWSFTALALFFTAMRVYVRRVIHKMCICDDMAIIVGSLCSILANIFVTISVSWGNGQHFDVLSLEQKQNTIKWMMVAYVPAVETLGLPKLAVISLLVRLLAPRRLHAMFLWSMGAVCVLSLTAMVMTMILQCSPPQALWTFSMERHCLRPETVEGLAFWASTCSAVLDFYLAIYPAVVLWKLQMPVQKKLAISCALGVGLVSGCVGIVKATAVPTLSSRDVSFDLCDLLYWTLIEGNLIVIAACIPLLQPMLEKVKGSALWRSSGDTSGLNDKFDEFSKQNGSGAPMELGSRGQRKKVDAYGFTIHAKEDSEENIISNDKDSSTTSADRESGTFPSASREETPHRNIVVTDHVTIAFDNGEAGPPSATTRWAAV